jgi:hypothetical protein
MTTKDDDLHYDLTLLGTESSGSKDSAAAVSFDENLSEKNVKEPMSEDQTEPMTTFEFIDVDELNALSQLRQYSEQNTVTDSENVTPESMTKIQNNGNSEEINIFNSTFRLLSSHHQEL